MANVRLMRVQPGKLFYNAFNPEATLRSGTPARFANHLPKALRTGKSTDHRQKWLKQALPGFAWPNCWRAKHIAHITAIRFDQFHSGWRLSVWPTHTRFKVHKPEWVFKYFTSDHDTIHAPEQSHGFIVLRDPTVDHNLKTRILLLQQHDGFIIEWRQNSVGPGIETTQPCRTCMHNKSPATLLSDGLHEGLEKRRMNVLIKTEPTFYRNWNRHDIANS